ncbi:MULTISPECIES: NAD(P)-dependent oxidoreductase [Dickeya]|uniref:2-hydroxy-3-oxopropionate reductase n=1 Tax=Dickeya aquatica TaxID=1401087 RepID=A0A375A9S6_9GAMM|nr:MULTISPECIES: NAD(P)-binding domain-containing protein [Dickeya]SLM62765.1 2-hydroxy-3-oxopropionate reductase [Dickeya aquatica]
MKIAVIGTGIMGSALAIALMKSGYEVYVYNRTKEKTAFLVSEGAILCETPADAIKCADASVLVLANAESVKNVILSEDVLSVLKGSKILNASTTTSTEIDEISSEVSLHGGELSETSIMVGGEELKNKQGAFILACPDKSEKFWSEILGNIGVVMFRAGDTGNASKAEVPMLFSSLFNSVLLAYSAVAAEKLGLSKEIIKKSIDAAGISGAEWILPSILEHDYTNVMASVESYKQVSETTKHYIHSLGMPSEIIDAIDTLYDSALSQGLGKLDGSAISQLFRGY